MLHEYLVGPHLDPAFVDERGEITNILSEPLRHVAIITSKAGAVRGHHYHLKGGQYIYVISGRLVSVSQPVEGAIQETDSFEAGAGALLYCPPKVAHAYRFLEDTVFLNLDTAIRNLPDGTDDTRPFTITHPRLEVLRAR